ncbi:hypothetical protein FNT36_24280 [Hymenobacter setariae]|jgi:hypothetical protein|uniref:Uncharacterized protein n=1 Tax=Hymenobacter setariae TaxID=2594794 RepID=A0A558BKH1_9BACT|nr:hypothetical protein [Hymenobacter setariae]TVT36989.1 hypothetical protein FNT36_24280 [Hymenobacter setariae]
MMTNPPKLAPEAHYALLFPQQAIPAWALEKMELFVPNEFILREERVETVLVTQIVGTDHPSYGNKVRWIDLLTCTKKSSNFALRNWPGFLNAKTSNITLAHIAGTDKYYIYFGGNHRVGALKLADKKYITCTVAVAYLTPALAG